MLPPPLPPTPAGWYPDPERPGGWRWFDGRAWTEHRSAPPALSPDIIEAERAPARWLRAGLLVEAGAYVVQLVAIGAQFRLLVEIARGDDDFERSAPELFALAQVVGVVGLAMLVLRVIWLARAAEVGARLGRPARHSPGLAAAGWIIPVVNLWFPLQDVRALLPPESPEHGRIGWWWGLRLAGQFGVVAVIVASYAPVALQAVAVAVCALASTASVLLERELVAAVLAGHELAVGRGTMPANP